MRLLFHKLSFVLLCHIFNPFFERARRRDYKVDVWGWLICRYVRRYLPKPGEIPPNRPESPAKGETIWSLWLQGEENVAVKGSFRDAILSRPL